MTTQVEEPIITISLPQKIAYKLNKALKTICYNNKCDKFCPLDLEGNCIADMINSSLFLKEKKNNII